MAALYQSVVRAYTLWGETNNWIFGICPNGRDNAIPRIDENTRVVQLLTTDHVHHLENDLLFHAITQPLPTQNRALELVSAFCGQRPDDQLAVACRPSPQQLDVAEMSRGSFLQEVPDFAELSLMFDNMLGATAGERVDAEAKGEAFALGHLEPILAAVFGGKVRVRAIERVCLMSL